MFLEELKDSLDGLLELMDEDNEYGENINSPTFMVMVRSH